MRVRALGQPEPLPLGGYTGPGELGRQRGLQRALAPYGPISVRTHAHARARDSTIGEICLGALRVSCDMCLDTACVSKATNWWEHTMVVLGPAVGVPRMGTYRWHRREKCR